MEVRPKEEIDKFIRKHRDTKGPLGAWYKEAKSTTWRTSIDIKNKYSSVSFLEKNYVIFNIKGNKYRLVTKVAYKMGVVYIKWFGTHAEYDKKRFP